MVAAAGLGWAARFFNEGNLTILQSTLTGNLVLGGNGASTAPAVVFFGAGGGGGLAVRWEWVCQQYVRRQVTPEVAVGQHHLPLEMAGQRRLLSVESVVAVGPEGLRGLARGAVRPGAGGGGGGRAVLAEMPAV